MKNKFSVELKIIVLSAVVMLALVTVCMFAQMFERDNESITFVYNSASVSNTADVNISDIL